MRRIVIFDRDDEFVDELREDEVLSATMREEINGEHSLEITTTHTIPKGYRVICRDNGGGIREYAVCGVDAEHTIDETTVTTYSCPWSIQEDLQGVIVSVMPGVSSPVSASSALSTLLSGQSRWIRGTVTQSTTGGASMYDMTAWDALGVLVDTWGGEIDAGVTTSNTDRYRRVYLYDKIGNQTPTRRFDFGFDIQGVKRIYADEPLYCRISPRGKGEQTSDGYGRKITIESVNDGDDYLEYNLAVSRARLYSTHAQSYEYPTLIVENSDCETPAELKTWAQGVLAEACTPKITYDIDVELATSDGIDFTGVSLGDMVQIVDHAFANYSDAGIQLEGRIIAVTTDLLNERDVQITIGTVQDTIAAQFQSTSKQISSVEKQALDSMYSLKTTSFSASNVSIAAGANYYANLGSLSSVSGYTPISANFNMSGMSSYDKLVAGSLQNDGTYLWARIYNSSGTASTGSLSAKVYWLPIQQS